MSELSTADHDRSPPTVNVPRHYNAAFDLIERNLAAGRGAGIAYIDDAGRCSYAELAERTARFANGLLARGFEPEQRVLLCMHDTIDLPVAFLGAIRAGLVPIPVNTLLTPDDFAFMLEDSRAALAVVSAAFLPVFEPLLERLPRLRGLVAAGATTILMAERPTPASVFARLRTHRPTVFYGVPTLYAAMLASPELPQAGELRLRRCVSAGEPLPEDIGRRWSRRFGVDILDGIGSTEMLHIFLSNVPGDVRYGTTGRPVPGYAVRLLDESGRPVAPGEIGELQVSGPTSAAMYWNNRDKSRHTFEGPWTRTGDKFTLGPDGRYVYAGRSDDMLKVSGIYVSPAEVEAALISHPAVLEAAVVGRADSDGLLKPAAYVVLRPGIAGNAELAGELRQHVKALLAPYKYPRWIEFIGELPKTATGKIQRFRLRGSANPLPAAGQ